MQDYTGRQTSRVTTTFERAVVMSDTDELSLENLTRLCYESPSRQDAGKRPRS